MDKAFRLSVLLLFSVFSLHAQEATPTHSPFGCSGGAVGIELDKHPPLHFSLVDRQSIDLPGYSEGREFVFTGEGPYLFVKIFLTATIPESPVGRGSTAHLAVYVETADNADDYHSGRAQWWRLDSTPSQTDKIHDRASKTLNFEASRVARCFNGNGDGNCEFADIALATPEKEIPLINIGFTEDLGGANAANWSEARLLLDFRSSPPRVAITADCDYNESGGACTAYDSGNMERNNLECDWKGDAHDLLCTEKAHEFESRHRDFYLFGDVEAPLRSDKVASLSDALARFKTAGHAAPVKVRGIGPMAWIDELRPQANKSVVLGNSGKFYFVPTTGSHVGQVVSIQPRPFLDDDAAKDVVQTSIDTNPAAWTGDLANTFASREIFRDRRLHVIQIVEKPQQGMTGLYWVGIDADSPALIFDAVQLAGYTQYAGCANYDVQATAVQVVRVGPKFDTTLRVQPATVTSDSDRPLEWKTDTEDDPGCVRTGKLWWKDGKFHASVETGICKQSESPRYTTLHEDGTITLSDTFPQ